MYYKQLLLSVAAIFCVTVFFNTALYSEWYNGRISNFRDDIYDEMSNLDYGYRKSRRWGAVYELTEFTKKVLGKDSNVMLVLPHAEYVKKVQPLFVMPEPITFYYHTGIKATFPEGKDTANATHGVYIDNGGFRIMKIRVHEDLVQLKKIYAGK